MTSFSTFGTLLKVHHFLSVCVCVMMSSEPVATVITLINHAVPHLKTLIPTKLLNTHMIFSY
jgi:hypothetical protein